MEHQPYTYGYLLALILKEQHFIFYFFIFFCYRRFFSWDILYKSWEKMCRWSLIFLVHLTYINPREKMPRCSAYIKREALFFVTYVFFFQAHLA